MTYLVDKQLLLNTFSSVSFDDLEQNIDNIAPSMCEYYLNDLINNLDDNNILNKSNIQNSIYFNEYSIYLDYNANIFIDVNKEQDNYETNSLW